MMRWATQSVEVVSRSASGYDALGNRVVSETVRRVPGVLPDPGATTDLGLDRPDGVRVDITFHWPREDTASLRGCDVVWGGSRWHVVGDPLPMADELTPGPFNRAVQGTRAEG